MQEKRKLFLTFWRPNLMQVYLAGLAGTACVLVLLAVPHGLGNPYAVLGLAAVAALAERGRVSLGGPTEASISLLPTVFAAAVFGPLAGALVAAASFLGDFPALLPATPRPGAAERRAPFL